MLKKMPTYVIASEEEQELKTHMVFLIEVIS